VSPSTRMLVGAAVVSAILCLRAAKQPQPPGHDPEPTPIPGPPAQLAPFGVRLGTPTRAAAAEIKALWPGAACDGLRCLGRASIAGVEVLLGWGFDHGVLDSMTALAPPDAFERLLPAMIALYGPPTSWREDPARYLWRTHDVGAVLDPQIEIEGRLCCLIVIARTDHDAPAQRASLPARDNLVKSGR
jgi:hypothetical protein